MSAGISAQNIKEAYFEMDKELYLEGSKREYNIHHDDGMTLKIPHDNMLDSLINFIDNRRLKLEKKAEVLHDYYGDRLLAKEIFQQYLGYKFWVGGLANLLTLGILGGNLWSRVMKNSVFMGKFGTIASVVALQAGSRCMTNNYLESEISRPWKIHCHRMSKGLGPTNIPSNQHSEEITTPLRFEVFELNPKDLLFGTSLKYQSSDMSMKIPMPQSHYPFAIESWDITRNIKWQDVSSKRLMLSQPEDDGDTVFISPEAFKDYVSTGNLAPKEEKDLGFEIYKNRALNTDQTIYVPDSTIEPVNFQANELENLQKDGSYFEDNEYSKNPYRAEIIPDLPGYAWNFVNPLNVTDERIDLLKHHILQRMKFKHIKRRVEEIMQTTKDQEEVRKLMEEFKRETEKEDNEFKLSQISVAAPDVETNFLDEKKSFILQEGDKNAMKEYYENVVLTRPIMLKEKPKQLSYDFDFEVDIENYNPWDEYSKIYKDLLIRGRSYYILKSMPEWYFLQIGRPQSYDDETFYKYSLGRYNYRDSIFNILSQERYFQERYTKEGKYRNKSQAIRI